MEQRYVSKDSKHLIWELRLFAVATVSCGVWSLSAGNWNDPTVGFGALFVLYYTVAAVAWTVKKVRNS